MKPQVIISTDSELWYAEKTLNYENDTCRGKLILDPQQRKKDILYQLGKELGRKVKSKRAFDFSYGSRNYVVDITIEEYDKLL